MKRKITMAITLVAILLLVMAVHLVYMSRWTGSEEFPPDTYLDSIVNRTALIVVAHDDDAIGCSGTVTMLSRKGWKIYFLTFYGHYGAEDNPIRKQEAAQVAGIQKLAGVELVDFPIQRSDTTQEPWRPVPYSRFPEYMNVDTLKTFIGSALEKYHPSVVFTLDNVTGGYGHPEHVCVSQCVLDVCHEKKKADPDFSVEKIYQAVFTKSLNETILKNNPTYTEAKRVYGVEGTPPPDVEVDIYEHAKEKKAVMQAYASQQRNIEKIWPYYNWYPYWIYFRIFNKEYFRIIPVGEL